MDAIDKATANPRWGAFRIGDGSAFTELSMHPGSDEMMMRLEATERSERELRGTHEIFYDDGDSVVMGKKVASTMEESRIDQDRGL